MASWADLGIGDQVVVRRKRPPEAGTTIRVRVVKVLPKVLGDGYGLVDASGATFRSFYYDVVTVEEAVPGRPAQPAPAAATRRPAQPLPAAAARREQWSRQRWDEQLQRLLEFVQAHDRLPRQSRSAEQPLAAWCSAQRRRRRDGLLPDDLQRQLETVPGWDWEMRRAPRTDGTRVASPPDRDAASHSVTADPPTQMENQVAQKVVVQLVDDLDGATIEPGAGSTVTFGIDRREYEIDLSDHHAAKFRAELAPYIRAARRINAKTTSRRNRTSA